MFKKNLQNTEDLLNQISAVVCKTNSNYKILYVNNAFTTHFGKRENLQELLDKSAIETLDQLLETFQKGTSSNKIEVYLKSHKKWYSFRVTKLKSNNILLCGNDTTDSVLIKESLVEKTRETEKIKDAVLNLLEDMSETQEDLRDANKDLRQLDELKNEFISIASHELRTPMTSIKGFLSMILEGDAGPVPKDITEFIEEAYASNEQLISLVNDMLDVSRIEQGKIVLEIGEHKVIPLINGIITRIAPIAKEGGNELILESKVKENITAIIDPKRFQQVLLNLLTNAIKFSEKSDVKIEVKIVDNFLSVSVIDQGIGMSEEDMEKLFQKFYQVRSGLARPTGGTGLGLYIAKNLINQMRGTISAQSEKGIGSTFTFTVPLHAEENKKPPPDNLSSEEGEEYSSAF